MRGVTQDVSMGVMRHDISIHTPHAGSDDDCFLMDVRPTQFQSTLPMRGVTKSGEYMIWTDGISIHTPHAGSDMETIQRSHRQKYFNPHSPCGE